MATAKLHGTFLPNPPPLSPFEWHEECFLLLMGPLTVGLNPRCAPILPDPPARPGSPPRIGTRLVDHHVLVSEKEIG